MNFYLNKYGFQAPSILSKPTIDLGIIIVIPCHNEPDLITSLNALYLCVKPNVAVEIITVINAGTQHNNTIKEQNKLTLKTALNWAESKNTESFQFHFIYEENLPKKHAGVGLARKIGMDEAVNRFDLVNTDGLIVCFDADSLCDPNYLVEIEQHFIKNKKTPGCAIHFEHPLSGNEFDPAIYKGIINYELHLRYYNQALKFAELPYAFHTVGSSMAVRSSAYQKQGGMNKRKAGEDFYFIHKIIALGNFTELKTTRVIPSPRISDRVPFGTGKAIGDWIESKSEIYKTYNSNSFVLLKTFVQRIKQLQNKMPTEVFYDISKKDQELIFKFLNENKFDQSLQNIRKNSTNQASFLKRFFVWFDAFKVLKFMHFLRDNTFENKPVYTEVNTILNKLKNIQPIENELEQLIFIRLLEKK